MKRKHDKQLDLPLKLRGGRRRNAGRRRKTSRPRVSHTSRARFSSGEPLLVTMRLLNALPSLRRSQVRKILNRAFAAGCDRFGFRLIHYSIQSNHLHLLVEARNRGAMTRGVQGLMVRIAKGLNRLWSRRGKVFSDRYHDRILRSPRQVRQPWSTCSRTPRSTDSSPPQRRHARRAERHPCLIRKSEERLLRSVPSPSVAPESERSGDGVCRRLTR